jgi:hypothetical protein
VARFKTVFTHVASPPGPIANIKLLVGGIFVAGFTAVIFLTVK